MNAYVGGGWYITHLTDRVCEMTKPDVGYRRLTGFDGFVRVRGEPGLDRQKLIEQGLKLAHLADDKLALILAEKLMPTAKGVGQFHRQATNLGVKFKTGEESQVIGRKAV